MRMYALPYPPSINNYYVAKRNGGKFINTAGRAFRLSAAMIVKCAGLPTMLGHLRVTVEVYPPDKRVRDLGNLDKCLMDALTNAGVWGDDGQIDDVRYIRKGIEPRGLIRIFISDLGAESHDYKGSP